MLKTTPTRLASFLVLLALGCHHQESTPPSEQQPVASVFSLLDPLPRAVGTYGVTLCPGIGTEVQFWYPLASGAPAGNLFVSMRDRIHLMVQEATKEQLAEMAECLKEQGIHIQPERSAAENYLLQAMTTRSIEETERTRPSIADGRFPMVILLHGSGDSDIHDFSSIGENLAAHGFLVTGVKNATPRRGKPHAPGESPEDWQAKVFAVIEGLQGRGGEPSPLLASVGSHVDFDRIGILGHSRGGRVSLLAMANPAHRGVLKAGISLDGPIDNGEENATTPSPFLFLMRGMTDPPGLRTVRLVANNNKLPGGASEVLDLSSTQPRFKHVGHYNFMDASLFLNVLIAAVPSEGPTYRDGFGDMTNGENRRMYSIDFHVFINRTLVDFFNKRL